VQFLIESAVIAATGGTVGIFLGLVAGWGISKFASWPSLMWPSFIWIAFGFSTATGVVFGLWPASQAARLSPAEALRYE